MWLRPAAPGPIKTIERYDEPVHELGVCPTAGRWDLSRSTSGKGVYRRARPRQILAVSSTHASESERQMSIAQTIDAQVVPNQRHVRLAGIGKPCGHAAYVGTCPACQRSQLARWSTQLAQVSRRLGCEEASMISRSERLIPAHTPRRRPRPETQRPESRRTRRPHLRGPRRRLHKPEVRHAPLLGG
jgi:hypothetical protein